MQNSSSERREHLPRVSRHAVAWFQRYINWYLRRNLHCIALSGEAPQAPPADVPLVVYANHPSWWDPLLALWLANRFTPQRTLFAPFDADALARYPLFERLGFFGVDQHRARGGAQFLRAASSILEVHNTSIWVTPEGKFTDPRETRADFRPGLAHLAAHMTRGEIWPLAMEVTFWEERLPEALVRFGSPIRVSDHAQLDKSQWNELLVQRLRDEQARLAHDAVAREGSAFTVLLGGKAGVGGMYEWLRRCSAHITGRAYRPQHSTKLHRS